MKTKLPFLPRTAIFKNRGGSLLDDQGGSLLDDQCQMRITKPRTTTPSNQFVTPLAHPTLRLEAGGAVPFSGLRRTSVRRFLS